MPETRRTLERERERERNNFAERVWHAKLYSYLIYFGYVFPIFLSGTALGEEYAAIGAPICGYGQYRIGNECYSYGSDNYGECDGDSVDGAACLNAFTESAIAVPDWYPFSGGYENLGAPFNVETESDIACGGEGVSGAACLNAFTESAIAVPDWYPFSGGYENLGAPFNVETESDIACGGDGVYGAACMHAFVESSATVSTWYPFIGGFDDLGAPGDAFIKMKENDCIGTMDGYYVTGIEGYSRMQNAECAQNTEPYVIPNDCQYIDMALNDSSSIHSPLHSENWMCAVLCDTGYVYTGTGACSQYCVTDDKTRRLHVSGAGHNFSVPLYTDKLTQPAMHFKIYEKSSGEHKMCYMNMLPRQGKDKLAVQYYDTVYYSSK